MSIDSRDVTAIISNGGIVIGHRSLERPPRAVSSMIAWASAPRFAFTGATTSQAPEEVEIPSGVLYVGAAIRIRALYSKSAGTSPVTTGYLFNASAISSSGMFATSNVSARIDCDLWVVSGGILAHSSGQASTGGSATGIPALLPFTPGAAATVAPFFALQNAGDNCTLEAWRIEVTAPDV